MNYIKMFSIALFASFILSGCAPTPRNTLQNPSAQTPIASTKPYKIGSVDTAFKFVGPDHQIEIWAVPDPKISGITCFYSRAVKGGVVGGLGLAEDTSDASVACRQTGPITFLKAIKTKEEIWNESTSILFKKIRIVRFYDTVSNSLVYLVYSDKLIEGSPKNSISAIALEGTQVVLEE